jgi:hypothetical protein
MAISVMEEICREFSINSVAHIHETVDRYLDTVQSDPEGIQEARREFLYGKEGLRARIAAYLIRNKPSIDFDSREECCDFATEELEKKFQDAFTEAKIAEIVRRNSGEICC